jgi:hypothetical protein
VSLFRASIIPTPADALPDFHGAPLVVAAIKILLSTGP